MHTIVKLDKVYNTFLEFVQVKNIKGPIDKKEGCVYISMYNVIQITTNKQHDQKGRYPWTQEKTYCR